MKTFCVSLTLIAAFFLLPTASSYGAAPLIGVIRPVSGERINALAGERAATNLGTKHGLVKGDIGIISLDPSKSPDSVLGKCAVTSTEYDSSVCEIIKAKREITKGNYILFDLMQYTDGNYYSIAMNALASVLEPYEPYVRLKVCIFGMYNSENAVTGLSDGITKEFVRVFSQKPRIELINKAALRNLVIYPDLPPDLLVFTRNEMKRAGIDVLLLGRYNIVGSSAEITTLKIDRTGNDKAVTFSFPLEQKYTDLDSKVLLTPQEMTKSRTIPGNIVLRSTPKLLNREDKAQFIKIEAAGNPLIEQALKGLDFNMTSPVEVKARVDEQTLPLTTRQGTPTMLSTGTHTMTVSFKRGYFFNETLLYTSEQEVVKEAILNLNQEKGLVVEVGINALLRQDPISFTIYHPTQRQRQVLKPIYGVESDRTVESFKD
jgi:hypothetical protein